MSIITTVDNLLAAGGKVKDFSQSPFRTTPAWAVTHADLLQAGKSGQCAAAGAILKLLQLPLKGADNVCCC